MSVSRDSGTLFTGFTPVESSHSGETFNPWPLPAPSLHSYPLYMDMFYFHISFLLAALSAAQQGINSLLIGTYLGNGRNPIFSSNPCFPAPSSCPPPGLFSLSQTLKLLFVTIFSCRVIPCFPVSPCPPLR